MAVALGITQIFNLEKTRFYLFNIMGLFWLTRFISNSVMFEFLTRITFVIILSPIFDFTGFVIQGGNYLIGAGTLPLWRAGVVSQL